MRNIKPKAAAVLILVIFASHLFLPAPARLAYGQEEAMGYYFELLRGEKARKAEVFYDQAVEAYKNNDFVLSEEKFRQVLELQPEHKNAKKYIEVYIPRRRGKAGPVKTAKEGIVKEQRSLERKNTRSQTAQLYSQAVKAYKLKDFDSSEDKFSEILAIDPEHKKAKKFLEVYIPKQIESAEQRKKDRIAKQAQNKAKRQLREIEKSKRAQSVLEEKSQRAVLIQEKKEERIIKQEERRQAVLKAREERLQEKELKRQEAEEKKRSIIEAREEKRQAVLKAREERLQEKELKRQEAAEKKKGIIEARQEKKQAALKAKEEMLLVKELKKQKAAEEKKRIIEERKEAPRSKAKARQGLILERLQIKQKQAKSRQAQRVERIISQKQRNLDRERNRLLLALERRERIKEQRALKEREKSFAIENKLAALKNRSEKASVKGDKAYLGSLYALGNYASRVGLFNEAIKAFNKIIEHDPGQTKARDFINVRIPRMKERQMQKELRSRKIKVDLEINSLYQQALEGLRNNNFEEATNAFVSILALDPQHKDSKLFLNDYILLLQEAK